MIKLDIHPCLKCGLKIAVYIYALRVCCIKEALDFEKMINTFDINMNASFLWKVPQRHLVQCTMKCFLAVHEKQMHFIFGYNLHTNMI